MYIVNVHVYMYVAMLFCAIWPIIGIDKQLVVEIFQVLQWSREYLWYTDDTELKVPHPSEGYHESDHTLYPYTV